MTLLALTQINRTGWVRPEIVYNFVPLIKRDFLFYEEAIILIGYRVDSGAHVQSEHPDNPSERRSEVQFRV